MNRMGTDKDRETLRGIIDRDRIQREIDRKKAEYVCETVREMMGYGIGCGYEINYSTGVWTFYVSKDGELLKDVLQVEFGDEAFAERADLSPVYVRILQKAQVERGWKIVQNPCELPPIGLKPRYVHEEQRMREIAEAVDRMFEKSCKVPLEWIEEYNELCERSESRRG